MTSILTPAALKSLAADAPDPFNWDNLTIDVKYDSPLAKLMRQALGEKMDTARMRDTEKWLGLFTLDDTPSKPAARVP